MMENMASQESALAEPTFKFPPIAGFWRRFAAWTVDSLLLGLIGQVLGWTLSLVWFRVGPYGRLVGLPLTLCYFGLMNSRIGNGQTVGKRLLKIAVRDQQNAPIGIGRSFLRISILAVPLTLNAWGLPILLQFTPLVWLQQMIIFGVGVPVLYTMVFNRRARQGLHDLVCGTYVVRLAGAPTEAFPRTGRLHLIVSGALMGLIVLGTIVSALVAPPSAATRLAPVYKLQQALQTDRRFFGANITDNTLYLGQGKTVRSLQIQAWYKGVPSNEERSKAMNDVAQAVLTSGIDTDRYDLLRIGVTSAYDIGIASGHISFADAQPVAVWQQRVSGLAAPNQ